uniref:Transposase DDE domain group 1 n=1 Tax=Candidatus Kentrum sp. TUN TaxID=2126343 RepID=A0A450ZZW1_9GAMM|nr:MAG: hypothetical protein BECKTUN1418F_GA0071002_105010 [Candidatus Kentron sp. TUN]VFK56989.1 MAG: hypothetical protein BECKTUN1418D_GA0071000_10572 [Candidatus Kentron sp. TUN]VFK59318.1 MAG: hypothetical protein BECKTUN1418E_GA0071001_10537 [Candidatus Kentron sp. TUN]
MCQVNMLALRAKTKGGWLSLRISVFSRFLFFRYMNRIERHCRVLLDAVRLCGLTSILLQGTRFLQRTKEQSAKGQMSLARRNPV